MATATPTATPTGTPTERRLDPDTDFHCDTDSDADGDTVENADGHTDADADSSSGSHCDTDADAHGDTVENADAHADADADPDADAASGAHGHADGNTHAHADSHADALRHAVQHRLLYVLNPCRLIDTRNPRRAAGWSEPGGRVVRLFTMGGCLRHPGDGKVHLRERDGRQSLAAGRSPDLSGRRRRAGLRAPSTSEGTGLEPTTSSSAFHPTGGRRSAIKNDAAGPVDVVLDVNGYFR